MYGGCRENAGDTRHLTLPEISCRALVVFSSSSRAAEASLLHLKVTDSSRISTPPIMSCSHSTSWSCKWYIMTSLSVSWPTWCTLKCRELVLQAAQDLHQTNITIITKHINNNIMLSVSWQQICQSAPSLRIMTHQLHVYDITVERDRKVTVSISQVMKEALDLLLLSARLVTWACLIRQHDWSRSMDLSFKKACRLIHNACSGHANSKDTVNQCMPVASCALALMSLPVLSLPSSL